MKFGDYPKVGSFQDVAAFRAHLRTLELAMPCDDAVISGAGAPLSDPIDIMGRRVGNRFAVQPMEGWDALQDGRPSERTKRRWRHFGLSGAKLVWGGEAVAVRPDGRAKPNQLYLADHTHAEIRGLREVLVAAHREVAGGDDDLLVGLQLTHSGRFCRPNDKSRLEPLILYRHPLLDRKAGPSSTSHVMTDGEIEQ